MKNSSEFNPDDLLWRNISELPYFRGFLRAVEGSYYQKFQLSEPILDLGCGDGHFSARTLLNKRIYGIDPSFNSLNLATNLKFYSGLVCTRGNQLPFMDCSYPSVISNSVLEHIQDVDAVIKEAFRLLKTGGFFVLTVPNSNFSNNLSVSFLLDKLGLKKMSNTYRRLFNWISRHHHPDPTLQWLDRLKQAGFQVKNHFNYFPPSSLKILEWGHFWGLPSFFNHKIFGRWVLFQSINNIYLKYIYRWLNPIYQSNQKSMDGAYTFIIAEKN
jgi:SAM-dependent methyltransferase